MRQEAIYHKWSQEELDMLDTGVKTYGHKWKVIQSHLLPNLSVQTIKNKYYAAANKQLETADSSVSSKPREMSDTADSAANLTREDQKQLISKLSELLGFM